jgi:hypothetical protein
MDIRTGVKALLVQLMLVGVLAVILAIALPKSFFEDWGWLAGPAAWGGSALVAGAVLRLPLGLVLVGAALSGLPMLVGVAVGIHWIGSPLGLAVFGAWCGWLADRGRVAVAA